MIYSSILVDVITRILTLASFKVEYTIKTIMIL